jgi:hypothetical protein
MNHTCTAPIEENDLRLLLIIRRVTVKWGTAKALIIQIKTWKWHHIGIKLCSGNPTFFRSITWNSLYPFSISWHYTFKCACEFTKIFKFENYLWLWPTIFCFWFREILKVMFIPAKWCSSLLETVRLIPSFGQWFAVWATTCNCKIRFGAVANFTESLLIAIFCLNIKT